MPQPAALLILPSREHADDERTALEATARLLTQGLEDLRLAERVVHALHASGHGSLQEVEVSVCAGAVTLAGDVPNYYLKQLAQATVLTVSGPRPIRNDLKVVHQQ